MSVMTKKRPVKEGLSDEAMAIDRDHEVQMARAQLYHLANDAIRLHKLLKNISETDGLEGWIQSKITLASDYVRTAADYLEYDKLKAPRPVGADSTVTGMPESVSAGGMGAGSVAVAPVSMKKKPLVRR